MNTVAVGRVLNMDGPTSGAATTLPKLGNAVLEGEFVDLQLT